MTTYQRLSDLQVALREWMRGGRKGTAPRKVRANSNETKRERQLARVSRDRKRRRMTKYLQRMRRAKGQNVISGGKRT